MKTVWKIIMLSLLFSIMLSDSAAAWTRSDQTLSNAEMVIGEVFCEAEVCFGPSGPRPEWGSGPFTREEWETAIWDAVIQWNSISGYGDGLFDMRSKRSGEDPCQPQEGAVAIVLTEFSTGVCGGHPLPPTGAGAIAYTVPPVIYVNTSHRGGLAHLRRLLVHELGHILGLGHPDQAGQTVRSIMNSDMECSLTTEPFRYCDAIQLDDIQGIRALHPMRTTLTGMGFLENPRNGSSHSGIGIISGWVCEADRLLIDIRRVHEEGFYTRAAILEPVYGTERLDTARACGDTDNGFGVLFNWNRLGDGTYKIFAEVDGFRLDDRGATVTVTTLGEPFLEGVTGEFTLPNFPTPGKSVVIEWEQSLQNFVIKDTLP